MILALEIGQRIERLVVRGFEHVADGGRLRLHAVCDCACGTKGYRAREEHVRSRAIRSCGCLRVEVMRKSNTRFGAPGRTA